MYRNLSSTDTPSEVSALVLARPLITPGKVIDTIMSGDKVVVKDGVIVDAKEGDKPTHRITGIFTQDYLTYEIMMCDLIMGGRFKMVTIKSKC